MQTTCAETENGRMHHHIAQLCPWRVDMENSCSARWILFACLVCTHDDAHAKQSFHTTHAFWFCMFISFWSFQHLFSYKHTLCWRMWQRWITMHLNLAIFLNYKLQFSINRKILEHTICIQCYYLRCRCTWTSHVECSCGANNFLYLNFIQM